MPWLQFCQPCVALNNHNLFHKNGHLAIFWEYIGPGGGRNGMAGPCFSDQVARISKKRARTAYALRPGPEGVALLLCGAARVSVFSSVAG